MISRIFAFAAVTFEKLQCGSLRLADVCCIRKTQQLAQDFFCLYVAQQDMWRADRESMLGTCETSTVRGGNEPLKWPKCLKLDGETLIADKPVVWKTHDSLELSRISVAVNQTHSTTITLNLDSQFLISKLAKYLSILFREDAYMSGLKWTSEFHLTNSTILARTITNSKTFVAVREQQTQPAVEW